MRKSYFLVLALLLITTFVSAEEKMNRTQLWKKVEEAKKKGLPKTAIQHLMPIYEMALSENDMADGIRALTEKIVMEGNIQGNKPEEKINALQDELEKADIRIKPLLSVVLARWYWQYYSSNSWRFIDRSATEGLEDKDFTTWDLPRLFAHIGNLYEQVLKSEEELRKIPISSLEGFLKKGNQPDKLRPTLFDFFAHDALDFYMSDFQSAAKPVNAFEIDGQSPALGPLDEFLSWHLETGDKESSNLRAIVLLQRLMRVGKETMNLDSLLDNDLLRLSWLRKIATGEGISERYIQRLEELVAKNSSNELAALAVGYMAREYCENENFVAAYEKTKFGIKNWPSSFGATICRNIQSQILEKKLSVTVEKSTAPKNSQAKIGFKNVERVYFRLLPRSKEELFREKNSDPDNFHPDEYPKIFARKPVLEWNSPLDPGKEYKDCEAIIDLPEMKKGLYFLVASLDENFGNRDNILLVSSLTVTNLAMTIRRREGPLEVMINDGSSGEPLQRVTIERQYNEGRYIGRDYVYKWEKASSGITDKNGIATLDPVNKYGVYLAQYNDDIIYKYDSFYSHSRGQARDQGTVYFFTDRSLYRPGQMIYVKGILAQWNTDKNQYKVVPNSDFVVSLIDPNHQTIFKESVKTNEFGSFSLVFSPSATGLTGIYRIESGKGGSATIRIEEYKRPKFKVSLEAPKKATSLGERVELKGRATTYAGAPVDGAIVGYRITRNVRLPRWCWWYYLPEKPAEIAYGTGITDKDGNFTITFTAKPDLSVSRDSQPIFGFNIHADVLDNTGETRSDSINIQLGYNSLALNLNVANAWKANQDNNFSLTVKTHDGIGQKAKGHIDIFALQKPAQIGKKSFFGGIEARKKDDTHLSNWKEGEKVLSLDFISDEKGIFENKAKLPPGAYRIVATSHDPSGNKIKDMAEIMAIDKSAKSFAVPIPFYFDGDNKAQPGDIYRGYWATGHKAGPAYIEIEHRGRLLRNYWTQPGESVHSFEYPVTEEMRGGFVIRIMQIKENRQYLHVQVISVPWDNKDLKLSYENLKSKMEPGSKNIFRMKIEGKDAQKGAIELLAGAYDASLDAYYPHEWVKNFGVFYSDRNSTGISFANQALGLGTHINNLPSYYRMGERIYPSFPDSVIQNFMAYDFPGNLGGIRRRASRTMYFDEMVESAGPPDEKAPTISMQTSLKAKAAPSMVSEARMESDSFKGGTSDQAEGGGGEDIDLDKVSTRSNLNELAFFYPQLISHEDGIVTVQFTIPEALTTWKFQGFAHGKNLEAGWAMIEAITQKDLMVEPNPPRFLREGDNLVFVAKVTNLSDKEQKGKIRLSFQDPITLALKNADFGLNNAEQAIILPPGESRTFSWPLKIPYEPGLIKYATIASTGDLSDGEEGLLPILTSRQLVTESLPLPIRGPEKKKFLFEKLARSGDSKTIQHKSLTIEATSNPAWYAVQALPYLMEYPHECSEQVFSRLYANALAFHLANWDPKIRRIFDSWKLDEKQGGRALYSNLEKNEHLKAVALSETPWLLDGKNETQAKHRIGLLFDENRLNSEIDRAVKSLERAQAPDGGFPWFPGGRSNFFITLYIMAGFGRLADMDIRVGGDIPLITLNFLDEKIKEGYDELKKWPDWEKGNHLNYSIAFYLYGRSFFLKDSPISSRHKEAVDFYLDQAKKYWLKVNSRMSQAHLALALSRFGENKVPQDIVNSIRERSVSDEELGMFWREGELSLFWHRAEIENQAMMIELFQEIAQDEKAVEECKIWLLKQKQTQNWKSTKATVDAIYSLIRRGADLLASDRLVKVSLAGEEIKPEKVEAGTGYYQKIFSGPEIKPEMGDLVMHKEDKGIAWGALHWQYLEDMDKITPHENNLKLKKSIFIKENTDKGQVIKPANGQLKVGDLVVIRLELRTDRDMEFVHLKDGRGAGAEPVDILSRYKYQDGLAYYQSTKDTASHFFIDYLPKGTYVFEYELRIQLEGEYQMGMAEIQCMYAPEFNSHSQCERVKVVK